MKKNNHQLDASMFTDHFSSEEHQPMAQTFLNDGINTIKVSEDPEGVGGESRLSKLGGDLVRRMSLM